MNMSQQSNLISYPTNQGQQLVSNSQQGQHYQTYSPQKPQQQILQSYSPQMRATNTNYSNVNYSPNVVQQQPIIYKSQNPVISQPIVTSYQPKEAQVVETKVVQNKVVDHDSNDQHLCLRWCVWCFPFLFAVAAIVTSSFLVDKFLNEDDSYDIDSSDYVLTFVSDNLAAMPINYIQQVDDYEACADGSSELTLATWSGVSYGCVCDDDTESDDADYCEDEENTCTIQTAQDAVELTTWPIDGTYRKICVGRVSSFSTSSDATCNDDETFCAPYFCIPDDESCPYTTTTETTTRRNLMEHEHSTAPRTQSTDDEAVLTFASNIVTFSYSADGTMVYTDITSTTGSEPCWDIGVSAEVTSGTDNAYQVIPNSGCGDYGSQTYIDYLDTELMSEVYEYSDDLQDVFDDVNDAATYYQNDEDNLILYAQYRIPADNSDSICQSMDSEAHFSDEEQQLLDNWLNGLSWAAIVISAIIIIITFLLLITVLCHTKNLLGANTRKWSMSLYFVGYILALICIIAGCLYYHETRKAGGVLDTVDYYDYYLNNDCFSATAESSINDALEDVKEDSATTMTDVQVESTCLFYFALIFVVFGFVLLALKVILFKGGDFSPWARNDSPSGSFVNMN